MNLYEYLCAMTGCYAALSSSEKEELHLWEAKHVDGSDQYASSDWPGWEKYIGKKPVPETKKTESFGYVYLIRLSSGECKIGKSKNVGRRIVELQTGNPNKINLLHHFPASNALKAESALHREFAKKRINNEWFSLNEEEIFKFCSINAYVDDIWK